MTAAVLRIAQWSAEHQGWAMLGWAIVAFAGGWAWAWWERRP